MQLTATVAGRLAALCLGDDGRLSDSLLASDAVRCGLLVDLALQDRVRSTEDSIEVDDAAGGTGPADQLLAAMTSQPDRPLDEWFGDRRLGLPRVVAALEAEGAWTRLPAGLLRRRARYAVADPASRGADLATALATDTTGWLPDDAAVAALAVTASLIGAARQHADLPPDVPEQVFARAGHVRWLVVAAVEHLVWARHRDRYVAGVLGAGGGVT